MSARDRRFWKFVEHHELFSAHLDFDPALLDQVIARRRIPRAWWRRITEEFEIVEAIARRSASLKLSQAGRKGGLHTQEKRRLTAKKATSKAKVKPRSSL